MQGCGVHYTAGERRVFPNAIPTNDFEASISGRTTTRNATPPSAFARPTARQAGSGLEYATATSHLSPLTSHLSPLTRPWHSDC
jgi:hypothetical protein